jgi:N6-adenosine-specific RNA methylase IME4
MSVAKISAVDVQSMADPSGCRLFLWTTSRYLRSAFDVMEAWGFTYKQTLAWHKTPDGPPFVTHIAPSHSEFILVGVVGSPGRTGAFPSSIIAHPNASGGGHRRHSAKPEAFMDYIEQASPGPYLELFARRNRLGWDTWGNESLEHVEPLAAEEKP